MKTASGAVKKQSQSPAADNAEGEPVGKRAGKRPGRRRWVLITGIVVVAGVAGGAAFWVLRDDGKDPAEPGAAQVTTATVRRQTLEQHAEFDGKLGYAGSYDVVNQAKGILTSLPVEGQIIRSGQVLYRVDTKPVIFLEGRKAPFYRALSVGMSGSDVKQLNAALVDLGYHRYYGPSATSDYFGWDTQDAVERLQDAVNAKETGSLAMGDIVFLRTDKIRVTERRGTYAAAASPGQVVLKASSTTPRVSIAMDASAAASVKAGLKVSVGLPNGDDAPGKVTSVGKVATTTAEGSTVPVEVQLSDPKSTGGLDAATVKVTIAADRVENVLAVPVTALLAMSGGGYSVELLNADGTRKLLPVKIGMFDGAAGMVEVSGSGLAAGQRVVVPAA